jgi:formate hydrogenlyase subunit 6/NADH:ubiquinone oxidoreductase subunit I
LTATDQTARSELAVLLTVPGVTRFSMLSRQAAMSAGVTACIGFMACERICPSTVITVVPDGKRESPVTGKKRGYTKSSCR